MAITAYFKGRDVVRWGIIGCGDVTEVKSGPGFQKANGSALVAVMRRNGTLAADYAKRHSVPRWYDDADALIRDSEVDAVYVATPPETHALYALKIAAAGKPAYIEKPMARNAAECLGMIDAFKRANLPLYVAYYRRRLPRFLKAEEIIGGGTLGKLTGVTYRFASPRQDSKEVWRIDAKLAGGGFFLDLGSHLLDLLDYFFGALTNVSGIAGNVVSNYAVEDGVAMTFGTKAGALGSATWNFASAVRDDTLRITGTEGELIFSVFGTDALRLETSSGIQIIECSHPAHVQQPLIQTVVDDLLGRGACPSTGDSALRTSQVMDQVLETFYGGRKDDFWNRPQTWPGRR